MKPNLESGSIRSHTKFCEILQLSARLQVNLMRRIRLEVTDVKLAGMNFSKVKQNFTPDVVGPLFMPQQMKMPSPSSKTPHSSRGLERKCDALNVGHT
jgi:hypothetical protein